MSAESVSDWSAERSYAYETSDEAIDRTIAFDPVAPERDFEHLFAWFRNGHLKPYWQLDVPRDEAASLVAEKVDDETLTPYVGYLDHVPMSYWEVYDATQDEIATTYDAASGDRGIHLFIGPPEYLGHGYAIRILRALARFQFERGATRLVSEPDVRNERAIGVFEQCGFEPVREIDVRDKRAQLLRCPRDQFEPLSGGV